MLLILQYNDEWLSVDCRKKYSCTNVDGITAIQEKDMDPCDANAKCKRRNGENRCHCNKGYSGDGYTCKKG